jgi:flagellar biosynthesis regulator FlbT
MSNITYDHNGNPIHGMFDAAETVLIEAAMRKDKEEITRLTKQNEMLVAALRTIADLKNIGKIQTEVVAFEALAAVKEKP